MQNVELHSLIFSDKPTKDDQLNFRDYARILADIALTSETPTTIGIFGEWGSGKSSLMMMVDEILKDKNVHTIWFNAWKYDKEDALWRSLILRIMEGLDSKNGEIEEIRRKLYTAISTEELGRTQINWLEVGKTITKEGIKAAATVALPLAGIGTIFANLGKTVLNTNSIDEISKAVTRQTIQRNQDRISSIEQFDELYLELVSKLLGKKERLVVFIDDLDRCTPLQALLVIEALKAFLGSEKCVYVVACDPRLIRKGFEQKYGAATQEDVSDYLEKIIQIYFEMPPLRAEDAELFLKNLGLGDDVAAIAQILLKGIESNPRKLKRFLNNLEIQNQLVMTRSLGIEKGKLIKLACIAYGWKQTWGRILSNPPFLSELQKFAVNVELEKTTGIPPEILETFNKESRLKYFLAQEPYFSDIDIDHYIFLAKATRAEISSDSKLETEEITAVDPYIVGMPLRDSQLFVGRDTLINILINELSSDHSPVISLFGQRRIGKTSVLLNLGKELKRRDFMSVYIDMQGYFGFVDSAQKFLYLLADNIQSASNQNILDKNLGKKGRNEELGFSEFRNFLDKVFSKSPEKRMVLLIDEFESIFVRTENEKNWQTEAFSFLRSLIQSYPAFKLVLCGLKSLTDLSKSLSEDEMVSPFYNLSRNYKISYIDIESSKALIRVPTEGVLDFGEDVLNYIYHKTGGHPYLLQGVAHSIFELMVKKKERHVTIADVDSALENALFIVSTAVEYSLRSLDTDLLDLFRVLVNVSKNDEVDNAALDRLKQNKKFGDNFDRNISQLSELDFLIKTQKNQYRFAVPLLANYIREKLPASRQLEN